MVLHTVAEAAHPAHAERRAFLAQVPPGVLHTQAGFADACIVEVVARAKGGSARDLVRCLFSGITGHVHPVTVRPLGSL